LTLDRSSDHAGLSGDISPGVDVGCAGFTGSSVQAWADQPGSANLQDSQGIPRSQSIMIRTVSVAALCLTAAIAFAQGTAPSHQRGPDMERMTLLLDLDAGQKVAVQKVLTEQREQMMALRNQARGSSERPSREQMKSQFEKTRQDTVEKLRPILSDLQLKKFEALTERPFGPPGKRPGQE
jgi:hypothetical protein